MLKAALVLACVALCTAAPLSWIRADSRRPGSFVDEYGRVRVFHGVSAVQKGAPWYWEDFLHNTTRIEQLKEWGINSVRLGWMWSGAQPTEGVWNQTYFDITATIVDNLAAQGIHTILDMHQDGMSSLFCLYDGLPLWLVEKRSPPKHAFPYPLTGNCSRFWEDNFFAEATQSAYQDLYDNHADMAALMATFWERSATFFVNTSSILGYELINEPWAGDAYEDPLVMLPAVAGKKNLMPLYERVHTAVRSVDKNHVVFIEPVTWGAYLHGGIADTGLSIPGGPAYTNLTALSVHYYCPLYQMRDPAKDTNLTMSLCAGVGDLVFDSQAFDVHNSGMEGAALFLTEWGECDPRVGAIECNYIQNKSQALFMSQAWWDYAGHEGYDSSGRAILEYSAMLARTYARAIAGSPVSTSFDVATGDFHVCYNVTIAGPSQEAVTTEVFHAASIHYPTGATATSSTGNLAVKVDGNIITAVPVAGTKEGDLGCVEVARANA